MKQRTKLVVVVCMVVLLAIPVGVLAMQIGNDDNRKNASGGGIEAYADCVGCHDEVCWAFAQDEYDVGVLHTWDGTFRSFPLARTHSESVVGMAANALGLCIFNADSSGFNEELSYSVTSNLPYSVTVYIWVCNDSTYPFGSHTIPAYAIDSSNVLNGVLGLTDMFGISVASPSSSEISAASVCPQHRWLTLVVGRIDHGICSNWCSSTTFTYERRCTNCNALGSHGMYTSGDVHTFSWAETSRWVEHSSNCPTSTCTLVIQRSLRCSGCSWPGGSSSTDRAPISCPRR